MVAARIYEQSKLMDQALAAYQKALSIKPDYQEALEAVERLSGDDE